LCLLFNVGCGLCVQTLGLDEGEGNVTDKVGVLGQVNLLLTTFTKELFDLIAAVDEGSGLWGGCV